MKKIFVGLPLLLAGALALAGINGFFSYTNRTEFCVSCHSMQGNYDEYKETVHFKNASGVQAGCADCHVPKEFLPKVTAKIVAIKDVYHEMAGTVDSREKFESHRWEMANRVWSKMKATDSRECRTCHDFTNMDLSAQSRSARKKHARASMRGKTCIDCHKGIAHLLPDEPEDAVIEDDDDVADAASDEAEVDIADSAANTDAGDNKTE